MSEKHKLAVVAVGGNALIREKGKESLPDQYAAVCITMPHIVDMIQMDGMLSSHTGMVRRLVLY